MFACRCLIVMIAAAASIAAVPENPGHSRTFEMCITFSVSRTPTGAHRMDLWMPIPTSDAEQTVDHLRVDAPARHEIQVEPEYGNRVLHVWTDDGARLDATIRFRCTRREQGILEPRGAGSSAPPPSARLLEPDRLGVIDEQIRSLVRRITADKPDAISKARAIYEYVVGHMDYDKTVPGWGNGDTRRACVLGKGNCTDFHALFISLARASGIPARFEIGFQLPKDQAQSPVQGYHCWAEFWVADRGWVPVDCSEGKRNPPERAFYFGELDANRIRLSYGRDLALPGMQGPPLNYFVFPYGEADGKPIPVEKSITLEASPSR